MSMTGLEGVIEGETPEQRSERFRKVREDWQRVGLARKFIFARRSIDELWRAIEPVLPGYLRNRIYGATAEEKLRSLVAKLPLAADHEDGLSQNMDGSYISETAREEYEFKGAVREKMAELGV